jgi:uncharacterized protein YkwD
MRTISLHTFAITLAAIVVTGMLAAAPTGAAAMPAPDSPRISAPKYGKGIFTTTNKRRAENGRRAFRNSVCLHGFAVSKARQMARIEDMGEHSDPGPVMRKCHLGRWAENLAEGFPTGRAAVRGWMHSTQGHRENILNRDLRLIGVAARQGDSGRWYAIQVFGTHA